MEAVIDTLKIYERLKAANLTDQAAKEIAEVFKEVISDQVVTRQHLDLKLSELELRLKHDLTIRMAAIVAGAVAAIAAIVKLL